MRVIVGILTLVIKAVLVFGGLVFLIALLNTIKHGLYR
jgi:hypothetical protein